MKKLNVKSNVKLIAEKKKNSRKLDYYVLLPDQRRVYAFTKNYSDSTYMLCKSGVRIDDLLGKRTRNIAVMQLVCSLKYILPYLQEYYLPTEKKICA